MVTATERTTAPTIPNTRMTDLLTREEREELGQERKQEREPKEEGGEGNYNHTERDNTNNCDLKETNGTDEEEETPKSRIVTPDCESEDVMTLSSENATMREAVQVDDEELNQDRDLETTDTLKKSG